MDVDILIIGSGPAGASAACALVEAGCDVTLIDAGRTVPSFAPREGVGAWRSQRTRWRDMFGDDLTSLASDGNLSPKFSTPLGRLVLDTTMSAYPQLEASNFVATRTATLGGLSNLWGAFCSCYTREDWPEHPAIIDRLASSYQNVARRVGISGAHDDMAAYHGGEIELEPPVELAPVASHLLDRYTTGSRHGSFTLGRSRNAVITHDRDDRQACARCGQCLLGCHRKSIYSAGFDISRLMGRHNFRYLPEHVALRVRQPSRGAATPAEPGVMESHGPHEVDALVQGERRTFRCRTLMIAAGTINTTALVADYQGFHDTPIRLLTNPAGALAAVVPRFVGSPLPDASFGLGQLSYRIVIDGESDEAMGVLYGADTLPASLFASRMPLSAPVALRLSAALAPALVLATCYLHGRHSSNTVTVSPGTNGLRVSLKGETPARTHTTMMRALKDLSGHMRRHGAYCLPGSMSITHPGGDAHLAGTVPMGGHGPMATDDNGMLQGANGIYVIDGACLPVLPAKHCTMTIMANADRIAHVIASTRVRERRVTFV